MQKKTMKKEPKYVTIPVFEKGMDFIAKSFAKVFERFEQINKKFEQHDKAFELILKEMQTFRQESHEHKMMMGTLNHTDVMQHRKIEGLEIRIEKLEQKVK